MTEDTGVQRPLEAKPDFSAWVRGLKSRAETADDAAEGRVWTPIGERPPR